MGYRELVKLLLRRRDGPAAPAHAGLTILGNPRNPLLGLTLDNATPVFVNPFSLGGPLMIVGDAGTGKRFTADMLAARTRWCFGSAGTIELRDPETYFVDHYPNGRDSPADWTGGRVGRGKYVPHAVISYAETMEEVGKMRVRDRRSVVPKEVPFRGLLLRFAGAASIPAPYLTDAAREWLPRARVPKDAGYAEGVWPMAYGGLLPVAVVASTPEYDWLSAARPSVVRAPPA